MSRICASSFHLMSLHSDHSRIRAKQIPSSHLRSSHQNSKNHILKISAVELMPPESTARMYWWMDLECNLERLPDVLYPSIVSTCRENHPDGSPMPNAFG